MNTRLIKKRRPVQWDAGDPTWVPSADEDGSEGDVHDEMEFNKEDTGATANRNNGIFTTKVQSRPRRRQQTTGSRKKHPCPIEQCAGVFWIILTGWDYRWCCGPLEGPHHVR